MLKLLHLMIALFALAGTLVQAYQSARQLSTTDPSGHRSFVAIDELATEFSVLKNPIQWARQRRALSRLKRESPAEAREHSRVKWQLMSWVLLVVASGAGLLAALLE